MGILNTALGINIKENPIIFSPYTAGFQEGEGFPPIGSEFITTEDGIHIDTESATDIITE